MNFWNWIGSPSRDDVQQLGTRIVQMQEALAGLAQGQRKLMGRLDQIQEANQELLRRLDETETASCNRVGEVKDRIDAAVSAQGQQVGQLNERMRADEQSLQTQISLFRQIAENQNELLKLLVINALGEDINKVLPGDTRGGMPQ